MRLLALLDKCEATLLALAERDDAESLVALAEVQQAALLLRAQLRALDAPADVQR